MSANHSTAGNATHACVPWRSLPSTQMVAWRARWTRGVRASTPCGGHIGHVRTTVWASCGECTALTPEMLLCMRIHLCPGGSISWSCRDATRYGYKKPCGFWRIPDLSFLPQPSKAQTTQATSPPSHTSAMVRIIDIVASLAAAATAATAIPIGNPYPAPGYNTADCLNILMTGIKPYQTGPWSDSQCTYQICKYYIKQYTISPLSWWGSAPAIVRNHYSNTLKCDIRVGPYNAKQCKYAFDKYVDSKGNFKKDTPGFVKDNFGSGKCDNRL
jgi:hypothetical protein